MSVESLKAQRSACKKSFNSYAKRRDAVRKIINSIDGKFDDDVRDVNNEVLQCKNELLAGLRGIQRINDVGEAIEDTKESNVEDDARLKDCRNNLSLEATRCQQQINAMDRQIRQYEMQIKAEGGTIYFWE